MNYECTLWITSHDCGDGSVRTDLHSSLEDAKKSDNEEEESGSGFAEATAKGIKLRWNGNTIQYQAYDFSLLPGDCKIWKDLKD